jgi:hypothetical protein
VKFLKKLFDNILDILGLSKNQSNLKYTLKKFENRKDALLAGEQFGVMAIQQVGSSSKWAIFKCPCGCNEQVMLNLMQTHYPFWKVEIKSPKDFSIHPSIDSTTCKAHYWIKHGQVVWS